MNRIILSWILIGIFYLVGLYRFGELIGIVSLSVALGILIGVGILAVEWKSSPLTGQGGKGK